MADEVQLLEKQIPKIEVKVGLSLGEIIAALKSLDEEDRELFIENLLAALSPEYLKSIEEARKDYREGRVIPHDEIFPMKNTNGL